jgi:hypothetical protein
MIQFKCVTCGNLVDSEKVPELCLNCAAENSEWENLSNHSIEIAKSRDKVTPSKAGGPPGKTGRTASPSTKTAKPARPKARPVTPGGAPVSPSPAYVWTPPPPPSPVHYYTPTPAPTPYISRSSVSRVIRIILTCLAVLIISLAAGYTFYTISRLRRNLESLEKLAGTYYFVNLNRKVAVDIYSVPTDNKPLYYCSFIQNDTIRLTDIQILKDNSFVLPSELKIETNTAAPKLSLAGFDPVSYNTFRNLPNVNSNNKKLKKPPEPSIQNVILLPQVPVDYRIYEKFIIYMTPENQDYCLKIYSIEKRRITYSLRTSLYRNGIPFVIADGCLYIRSATRKIIGLPIIDGMFPKTGRQSVTVSKKGFLLDINNNEFLMEYNMGILGNNISIFRQQNNVIYEVGNIPFSLNSSSLLYFQNYDFYAVTGTDKIKYRFDGTQFTNDLMNAQSTTGRNLNIKGLEESSIILQGSPIGIVDWNAYDRNGNKIDIKLKNDEHINYFFMNKNNSYLIAHSTAKRICNLYSVKLATGRAKLNLQRTLPSADIWKFSNGVLTGQQRQIISIYYFPGQ